MRGRKIQVGRSRGVVLAGVLAWVLVLLATAPVGAQPRFGLVPDVPRQGFGRVLMVSNEGMDGLAFPR